MAPGYDHEHLKQGLIDGESAYVVFVSQTTGEYLYFYYTPLSVNRLATRTFRAGGCRIRPGRHHRKGSEYLPHRGNHLFCSVFSLDAALHQDSDRRKAENSWICSAIFTTWRNCCLMPTSKNLTSCWLWRKSHASPLRKRLPSGWYRSRKTTRTIPFLSGNPPKRAVCE